MQNDFIGGKDLTDETQPTQVFEAPPSAEPTTTALAQENPLATSQVEAAAATDAPLVVEAKTYADGSSSTGVAPLPDVSPAGAPAVEAAAIVAEVEPVVTEVVDYAAKYAEEVAAHEVTKAALKVASELVANAKAMGFRGAGIHTGS